MTKKLIFLIITILVISAVCSCKTLANNKLRITFELVPKNNLQPDTVYMLVVPFDSIEAPKIDTI